VTAVVLVIYTTSGNEASQDFYHKTVVGMTNNQANGDKFDPSKIGGLGTPRLDHDQDGSIGKDDERTAEEVGERLREAEQKAKNLANSKAPNPPDNPEKLVGVGNSANKGDTPPGNQQVIAGPDSATASKDSSAEETAGSAEEDSTISEMRKKVDAEFNSIIKKAPIVIFSKTYCPFSKRAKKVLLEKYLIEPTPYVVELDEHPLGPMLQDKLKSLTGRATVPNVLVHLKSIGGSDEIAALDESDGLIKKLEEMGTVGGATDTQGKSSKISVKRRPTSHA